jgi:hypothetical protein
MVNEQEQKLVGLESEWNNISPIIKPAVPVVEKSVIL